MSTITDLVEGCATATATALYCGYMMHLERTPLVGSGGCTIDGELSADHMLCLADFVDRHAEQSGIVFGGSFTCTVLCCQNAVDTERCVDIPVTCRSVGGCAEVGLSQPPSSPGCGPTTCGSPSRQVLQVWQCLSFICLLVLMQRKCTAQYCMLCEQTASLACQPPVVRPNICSRSSMRPGMAEREQSCSAHDQEK